MIRPDGYSTATEKNRAAMTALRSLFKLWRGMDQPLRTVRRRMEVTLKVILDLNSLSLSFSQLGPECYS